MFSNELCGETTTSGNNNYTYIPQAGDGCPVA